jgi:glycosyltransferase involved in cell wall biosynthesis
VNSDKSFFSVVIPLYNKEKHIGNTIRSVLSQKFQDFELVIVNDGSTDNSLNIVRAFPDKRIKIFSKLNGGVSSARNYGVKRTTCDYIAFLDADDEWSPDYLKEMKDLIYKHPFCGLYTSGYKIVDKLGVYHIGKQVPEGVVKDYFKTEFHHEITRLSATVVHKPAFRMAGGFPVGMLGGEDSYFCACVALKNPVAYTPKPLVFYNKKFSGKAFRYDKPDKCKECWSDLYQEGDFYRNELIADKAIKAAFRYVLGFHKQKSREIEELTRYTKLSKNRWRYLYFLNRLPYQGIILLKIMKPYISGFRAVWAEGINRLNESLNTRPAVKKSTVIV